MREKRFRGGARFGEFRKFWSVGRISPAHPPTRENPGKRGLFINHQIFTDLPVFVEELPIQPWQSDKSVCMARQYLESVLHFQTIHYVNFVKSSNF